MDFINRLLGRTPSPTLPGPTNAPATVNTEEADRFERRSESVQQRIDQLRRLADPLQVAQERRARKAALRAQRAREAQSTTRTDAALAILRREGVSTGQAVMALGDLVAAEEKRFPTLAQSPLFATPRAEGSQLARRLLHRLGAAIPPGSDMLVNPHVRAGLTRGLDGSNATTSTLKSLMLCALSRDKTHDARVLRWCVQAYGPRTSPAYDVNAAKDTDALRLAAAELLARSLREEASQAVQQAEAAWARRDVAATLNALMPLAAVGNVSHVNVRSVLVTACGDGWTRATALAHRLLHAETQTDESMEAFRPSRTNAGWTSLLPLMDPIDEADLDALDRLHYYVGSSYVEQQWPARKARPFAATLLKVLEDHGLGESSVADNVRVTLAYRKSPFGQEPDTFTDNPQYDFVWNGGDVFDIGR